jgi:hypothetical protein
MGWPSSSLRSEFENQIRESDDSEIRARATNNDTESQARQAREGLRPGQVVGDDLSLRVRKSEEGTMSIIDKGRRQVSEDAGTLSANYDKTVRAGKISPNHGGNQAVWDSIGANADRPDIGTPPKVEPIGEWHINNDGTPVMAPKPIAPNDP